MEKDKTFNSFPSHEFITRMIPAPPQPPGPHSFPSRKGNVDNNQNKCYRNPSNDHPLFRNLDIVRSAPPNPSITAFAEGNSALDVKLHSPP
uniref:Uncharacterized protein n=1 Tax=Rhizophora mucronata TaxID=61149 RepID=A0A2P2L8Y5_RHIMU